MTNPKKRIAVIIINYNGEKLLNKFLPSIIEFSDKKISDIYVIDNNSDDDSVTLLKSKFPFVNTIINNKNYGYAKGYNEGIKNIKHDYFVFVNNDVEVTKNWLNPIFDTLESNNKIGTCQPKIISYNNKKFFDYAGASGGYIDYLGYPYCRGRIFDTIEIDKSQYNNETEIFWSSGSCFMIRSEIFFDLGGFDEDFFAHMEEIDLCWRVKRMGFINYCQPKSKVYHIGGKTLDYNNPRKTFLNFRNNLMMIAKNENFIEFLIKIPIRFILDSIASIKILFEKKSLIHFFSIHKAYFSFISYLPSILLKKRRESLNRISLKKIIIPFEYFIRGKKRFSDL